MILFTAIKKEVLVQQDVLNLRTKGLNIVKINFAEINCIGYTRC